MKLFCSGIATVRSFVGLILAIFGLATAQVAVAQATANPPPAAVSTCHGHFPNPITDLCWGCFFPLTLGGADIWPSDRPDAEDNPSFPICFCGSPIPRVGLAFGFWEPVRMIDVTTKPFCFPNLDGAKINPGLWLGGGNTDPMKMKGGASQHTAQYQVHYYIFPVFYLLELLNDFLCFEQASFDVAYISELDPTWQDDALANVIYPEGVLFANPLGQVACVADCIAANVKVPLDPLFWCSGCNGAMYPMTGNVVNGTHDQSARLAAERLVFKLHRTGVAWGTMGSKGMCGKYLMPILRKEQYRIQQINPVAKVKGPNSCAMIGAYVGLPTAAQTYPVVGEDVGYLLWRKRNCCALSQ